MRLNGKKGVSLVEGLMSIFLLSALVVGVLGAFFISNLSTALAKHRMAVMNILKDYIEREALEGYDGGSGDEADYFETVTSADPIEVTIDDRGTADESDDLEGTITPDPYFPDNMEDAEGNPISYSGVPYKIIGFIVNWTEDSTGQACTERATTYVAYHTSS